MGAAGSEGAAGQAAEPAGRPPRPSLTFRCCLRAVMALLRFCRAGERRCRQGRPVGRPGTPHPSLPTRPALHPAQGTAGPGPGGEHGPGTRGRVVTLCRGGPSGGEAWGLEKRLRTGKAGGGQGRPSGPGGGGGVQPRERRSDSPVTRPQPTSPGPWEGPTGRPLPLFLSVSEAGVGQFHPQGESQSPWALELQLQACPDLGVPSPQCFTPKLVLTSSLSQEGGRGVGEREERLGPWGCVMGQAGAWGGQVGTRRDPHPALGGGGPRGSRLGVTLTPPSCDPELIACGRER